MYKIFIFMLSVSIVGVLGGCGKKASEETAIPYEEVVDNEEIPSLTEGMSLTEGIEDLTTTAQENGSAVGEYVTTSVDATKPTSETIQQALKNAGLYQGSVDGKIGPKTKRAIETFQSQNGLKVDGKVGPKTWSMLAPYLTKQPSDSMPVSDTSAAE